MAERRAAEVPPQHTRTIESCGMCSTLICPHGLCRTCSRCEQCEENLTLLELPRCAARLTPAGEGSPSAHGFSRPRVRAVTERPEERFGLVGRVLDLGPRPVPPYGGYGAIDPRLDRPGARLEPEDFADEIPEGVPFDAAPLNVPAEGGSHHRCTPRYPASPAAEVEA